MQCSDEFFRLRPAALPCYWAPCPVTCRETLRSRPGAGVAHANDHPRCRVRCRRRDRHPGAALQQVAFNEPWPTGHCREQAGSSGYTRRDSRRSVRAGWLHAAVRSSVADAGCTEAARGQVQCHCRLRTNHADWGQHVRSGHPPLHPDEDHSRIRGLCEDRKPDLWIAGRGLRYPSAQRIIHFKCRIRSDTRALQGRRSGARGTARRADRHVLLAIRQHRALSWNEGGHPVGSCFRAAYGATAGRADHRRILSQHCAPELERVHGARAHSERDHREACAVIGRGRKGPGHRLDHEQARC